MGQKFILAAALLPLAACSSGVGTNPVTGGDPDTGTTTPSARDAILMYEPSDDNGSGYTTSFTYDEATDTFTVDNLAFDGDNAYTRDSKVSNLGPFAVYENASVFADSTTGAPINQFPHKVIYGVSANTTAKGEAATEFAIVRTGAYIDYGFGGFVYQRNGGVDLPSTGQALYSGDYAALRDFSGRGGIEYATGDMQVAIDFEDFDAGDAVQGVVTNRRIFDTDGNDITSNMLAALGTQYGGTFAALPTLSFSVGPGALAENGQLSGELKSLLVDGNGVTQEFENGTYYGLLSGDNADEIVGVLVVEADDPRFDSVTVRETGGFILYRP